MPFSNRASTRLRAAAAASMIFAFGSLAPTTASAATDFPFPSPDRNAYDFLSGLLCHIAGGLGQPSTSTETCLASGTATIDDRALPAPLAADLAALAARQDIDPQELLDWWDRAHLSSLDQRHQNPPIAPTLAEFVAHTGFQSWPQTVIRVSVVKRLTRVLYRSPEGVDPAISVAQTLETQTGDTTAPVRETEVAIERGDGSGNADFYAYNAEGRLSPTSQFPSGLRPLPSACLACHFHRSGRLFQREGM
jgi:hypothetical protein